MGVDRPLVGLEGDAVDRVQELAAGEHPARLADHGRQELELGRGELDRPAADRDPHAGQVDLDVGDPQHLGAAGSGRLGPPQHGPDPGHELLGAERLDHVVVGAQLQADDPVGLVPRAVSITIGTLEVRRRLRATSSPSRPGSPRSSTTRSGRARRASASATSPSPATTTSNPACSR